MLEVAQWVLHRAEEFRWMGEFGHSGGKMRHESEPEDGDLLVALAMFHGIYKRVARKVGVNEAMVSRVVHGGRSSPEISEAIHNELRAIRDYLNNPPKAVDGG
jgi:hypothetical protein